MEHQLTGNISKFVESEALHLKIEGESSLLESCLSGELLNQFMQSSDSAILLIVPAMASESGAIKKIINILSTSSSIGTILDGEVFATRKEVWSALGGFATERQGLDALLEYMERNLLKRVSGCIVTSDMKELRKKVNSSSRKADFSALSTSFKPVEKDPDPWGPAPAASYTNDDYMRDINRAVEAFNANNFHAALEPLDRALKFNKTNPDILLIRSFVEVQLGKFKEAAESCSLALAFNPNHQGANELMQQLKAIAK